MKEILGAIKNILLANWPAMIAVVILSIILKLQYDFSFILSLIILIVVYFALGCLIEYILQSYNHYKKTKSGKSEEQIKREAEIRERRRNRGLAMLEEEKKRKSSPSDADRTVRERPIRRRAVYTGFSTSEDDKQNFEYSEKKEYSFSSYRKKTPFDIEPPSEDQNEIVSTVSDDVFTESPSAETEDFSEIDEITENITEPEETVVNDDVFVNSDIFDELFVDDNSSEFTAESEHAEITEDGSRSDIDNDVSDVNEDSDSDASVHKTMSVDEIQRTTLDISKEIQSRVNTHRKRNHIIFDAYESEDTGTSDNSFDDDENIQSADDFEADIAGSVSDDDVSLITDAVDADQDKLDALYSEKVNTETNKPKIGFFSRAIANLKKKEEVKVEKVVEPVVEEKVPVTAPEKPKFEHRPMYVYPTVDIVKPKSLRNGSDTGKIGLVGPAEEEKAQKLVDTLKSFGIGVKITGITKGPAVTRFEFQPDIGVKISRIVSLTDDIALNLAASGVRMEAPIPGKSAIGIEIPNESIDTVYLYNVLNSDAYKNASSKIAFALGVDLNGQVVIGDIAKMPHMLIAGSTGSGKSVCINTIITSILYGASPDEVKFIMIDPKVVELGIYNGIPHLLIPVVTEPKKASAALAWAVKEVDRRYNVFAECNVRDLKSYNKIAEKSRGKLPKEPQIVIIVDELADLMMAASHDVETSIIRLAQKARAAGVHLVIATQRPSVDVITGLIKANIPSRIAFAVASQFDSRTILDTQGAEKLLGRGDMLYMPIGQPKAMRVQGAFVSDEEVEKLVEFIKSSYGTADYSEEVVKSIETSVTECTTVRKGGDDSAEDDADAELIQEAADLAFEFNQLSASFLQRKMKIGFNRAGRIIDTLEERGLLSKSEGSKPRQVIMTREEWDNL